MSLRVTIKKAASPCYILTQNTWLTFITGGSWTNSGRPCSASPWTRLFNDGEAKNQHHQVEVLYQWGKSKYGQILDIIVGLVSNGILVVLEQVCVSRRHTELWIKSHDAYNSFSNGSTTDSHLCECLQVCEQTATPCAHICECAHVCTC